VDLKYTSANGQLERVEFPSAGSSTPRWQVDYSYWNGVPAGSTPGGGLLRRADRVGMSAVEYRYDGSLPTQEQWTGRVQGTVARTYDSFFRPATDVVSAGSTSRAVSYGYDDDGLLTSIGASNNSWSYSLHRSTSTGMLDSTRIAPTSGTVVTSSADYDGYGDLANLRYSVGASELFQQSIHHDARGRVDVISERWSGGTPKVTSYGYDAAGRLATVTENSVLRREYEYDANGNRTKETRRDSLGSVEVVSVGAYDAQDRLLTYGTGAGVPEEGLAAGDSLVFDGYHAYAYTANGELTSRTLNSPGTTGLAGTYTYDAMGALVAAGRPAPGGTDSVTFALDGQHRRVAEYRNSVFERGWLYEGISIIAELSDSVTLAQRYVYGSRDHVPDLMWDADSAIAYRLVTDHLGSVRAVVRLTDGAIVQRTDYDVWGEVTAESNPELLSLGFAGGLRERTTGLVRYGARDYDATVGRWTAKDPIRMASGEPNLYAYCANEPEGRVDPTGMSPRPGETFLECLDRRAKETYGFALRVSDEVGVYAAGASIVGRIATSTGQDVGLQALERLLQALEAEKVHSISAPGLSLGARFALLSRLDSQIAGIARARAALARFAKISTVATVSATVLSVAARMGFVVECQCDGGGAR
jgi:RHS repeat-associated protein